MSEEPGNIKGIIDDKRELYKETLKDKDKKQEQIKKDNQEFMDKLRKDEMFNPENIWRIAEIAKENAEDKMERIEKEYEAFYDCKVKKLKEKQAPEYKVYNNAYSDQDMKEAKDILQEQCEQIGGIIKDSLKMASAVSKQHQNEISENINKPKLGRPTVFTPEIRDKICELVVEGRTRRQIDTFEELPCDKAIDNELNRNEEFVRQYARAKEKYAQDKFEALETLAATANDRNYNAIRLQVDTKKWVLSKMLPSKYGDTSKVQVDLEIKAVKLTGQESTEAQSFAVFYAQQAIKGSQKAIEEPEKPESTDNPENG